ncbi:MAG: hypothetical protein ISQ22_01190 [Rhizobiales bacterium]|nr:hypothetical protein [Hyphomicrobiales bacterium]
MHINFKQVVQILILFLPFSVNAADAPDIESQSVVSFEDTIANQYNIPTVKSPDIEHYLLFGLNLTDSFFHSKYTGGWPNEGWADDARMGHSETSFSFGYGIEFPIDTGSNSHVIEISYSPVVISGKESNPIPNNDMFFDIKNQLSLEYNFNYNVNSRFNFYPIIGLTNFDFSHQQRNPSGKSDFETQNITRAYLGGGIRTKFNEDISLKLSYKLYGSYYSSNLVDRAPAAIFSTRDPAFVDLNQVSMDIIYKY